MNYSDNCSDSVSSDVSFIALPFRSECCRDKKTDGFSTVLEIPVVHWSGELSQRFSDILTELDEELLPADKEYIVETIQRLGIARFLAKTMKLVNH